MAESDEYFPRGGKQPNTTYFKPSGNFLGTLQKGEKKKKKLKKKPENDDGYLSDDNAQDISKSYKSCAARLSFKTIKVGVTILGRVRHIHETKLLVSLPGNMTGTVMACHISETYNKLLEAYVNDQTEKIIEMREIFKPGQYVAVKVLEIDGTKLMLSMMPQHVNSGRTHSDVHKGDIFQVAVSSVEDHGYVMDIGIPNTRPFLPKNKTNPDIELDAGMLCWCCVKSVTTSPESSIVTLSSELSALQKAGPKRNPAQPLLPGTSLFFTVHQPLDNGIEGRVLEDTTAYIQRQHVDKVNGKKPALGQKIKARVLYVMPTRNTPFLTMKDIFAESTPDLAAEQLLKEGHVVEEAQVLKILGRSIHFKLGKGCIGTMSLRHVPVDEDLADEEVLAKSYPIGSVHRVRVVSYQPSDFVYLVSDRPEVLSQRYFTLAEVDPGDLVDVTVKTVAENHLLVDVGRLTGYIPQTQYSDAGVFVDPKKASTSKLLKKFKPGQELKARVLVVDREKQGLLLTLKPSLLSADVEVLKSYEDAEIGKAYTGFIRVVRDYILVSFFDNVTAYIPRNYVTKEPIDSLNEAFHIGQIVNCTILRVDAENKKMSGSLTTTPFWPESKREIKGKRKQNTNTDEIPTKKSKLDAKEKSKKNKSEEANDKAEKKTKKNKMNTDDSEIETESVKDVNVKNKKKKKNDVLEEKVSEESDAIETDIQEDSDQMLTHEDLYLIDLSDCTDIHKCKKRIVSLTKNVYARTRRMDKVDMKIQKIESKGLNPKNKKFHTAMHIEKLVLEQRITKLLDALKMAKEKLNKFTEDPDLKKKRKEKNSKKKEIESELEIQDDDEDESDEWIPKKLKKTEIEIKIDKTDNVDDKEENKPETRKKKDKKEIKESKKDIKVVESLEPALDVPSAKDFWSASGPSVPQNTEQDEPSSSDEEEQEQPKKKRKKLSVAEKLAKVREEEERVREMERRAIDSEQQPRSADQFERALLANPNSSQLWIAYMAFHLQATELDKARAVCRRALKTISFREEEERKNVWLALLNCETRFGTKESQQAVLEEALQANDPWSVHQAQLQTLAECGRGGELRALVTLVGRRYRTPEAFRCCGDAAFKANLPDLARQAMQKALTVLDKKQHLEVLVHFALLERNAGFRERAEALFEQMLAVYPQRVDVAAVYVDMLRKDGDINLIRQVMDRLTSHKLPARKMKILYKKWIEVEEKIGDPEKVEEIRNRAMEYVESAKF